MSKGLKIVIWVICFLMILFFVAAAALPTWLSTPSGTQTFVRWINTRIDGEFSLGKIDLNWLGKQRIEQFTLKDKEGILQASFHFFETDTKLLYLALGGRSFKRTLLEKPYLYITSKTEEKIEKELKKSSRIKARHRKSNFPFFEDALLVANGSLIFVPKNVTPITISGINIDKKPLGEHIQIQGKTEQGHKEGSIAIEAIILKKQFQAKVNILDFPIAVLDELDQSTFYTEALGPTLNVDLHIEKDEILCIHGSAKSENLSAYIAGNTENNRFILNPQTQLELTLTPLFFKQLIEEKQRGNWELASKTNLEIHVERGSFPLTLKRPNFKDITLQAAGKINRAELHHTSLGCYSLKQFDLSMVMLNNLEISYQGEIQGKEATKLEGNFSMTPEGGLLFDSTFNGFPVTLVSLVSPDLEKNIRTLFGVQFDLECHGTFADENLNALCLLNSPMTHLKGTLQGALPKLDFVIEGTHSIYGKKSRVLGNAVDFAFDGNALFEERSLVLPFLKGKISNPYFNFDVRGRIGEAGEPLTPEQIQLIATGVIYKLPVSESALQKGTCFIQVDGSKNLILAKAGAEGVDIDIEVQHFIQNGEIDLDKAKILFTSNLKEFPLAAVSPFISESADLSIYFGPSLSMQAKGSYIPQQEPRLILDVNAQGTGFRTSLAISVDETLTVSQDKPSYIDWEITPERYAALMQSFQLNPLHDPTFFLTRTTQLGLKISQFICPTALSGDISQLICQSGFVGEIHLGPTVFRSKESQESIIFQQTAGSIKGENFSEAIDLNLSGEILASNVPSSEKSAFTYEGKMLHLLTKEGKFNREGLTITGVLSLDLLPVRPITEIIPLNPETRTTLQALFGELLNARLYGEISQLTGPLTIDVKSSNLKAKLPLQLQREMIFLRDNVDAEITLTEPVNEILLKDVNPLLIAGASSEHPLKLHIDAQGFMLPLSPYSLQGIRIGSAVLDIGRIRVRSAGQVHALMEFLKAKEVSPDGYMEVWFTPIYFTLQEGIASYRRFDALFAGNVHIAMWGNINLLNDHVNMILAIGPTTLQERFKIKGLSKRDMFHVKMRGTTDHLELDWSAASKRIAYLVARTATGHLGSLIGGILETLLPSLGEEPSPPPTTDPLPWELK